MAAEAILIDIREVERFFETLEPIILAEIKTMYDKFTLQHLRDQNIYIKEKVEILKKHLQQSIDSLEQDMDKKTRFLTQFILSQEVELVNLKAKEHVIDQTLDGLRSMMRTTNKLFKDQEVAMKGVENELRRQGVLFEDVHLKTIGKIESTNEHLVTIKGKEGKDFKENEILDKIVEILSEVEKGNAENKKRNATILKGIDEIRQGNDEIMTELKERNGLLIQLFDRVE